MRRRPIWGIAVAAASTMLALVAATPAQSAVAAPGSVTAAGARTSSARATVVVANWQMNEKPGAKVMVDSGPRHLNGAIGTDVKTGKKVKGATAYRFPYLKPDTPPARPQHTVTINSSSLNPASANYAITFRYRTTHKFGNIIQKGQAKTAGGQVKIELPGGHVTCLYRGSVKRRAVKSSITINDGNWHTVRCERKSDRVVLTIDNSYKKKIMGWTGAIANTWPMTIGGKPKCNQVKVSCDYFSGDVDWVTVQSR
jgi:hypothetical protein